MSNYISLGSIFQLRKLEETDQILLEECLDQRWPIESRSSTEIGYTLQNGIMFFDMYLNNSHNNLPIFELAGILSKKSDNIDIGYVQFIFIKITEQNKNYYESNEVGTYATLFPRFGLRHSMRGDQLGRVLLPFLAYWCKYTVPNLLGFNSKRTVYFSEPNITWINFNSDLNIENSSRSNQTLRDEGVAFLKTVDIPERQPDPNFPVEQVHIIKEDQKVHTEITINWETVSENSDGKYYSPEYPDFSIAERLMTGIYDNLTPSSRTYDQVRNKITQTFV